VLYAFDGTWNRDHPGTERDSNVRLFVDACQLPHHYERGVGTRFGRLGRIVGGITGLGARSRVGRALAKLDQRLAHGDTNIDVIGFSRGAALALHFANQVWFRAQQRKRHLPIRFLGLWDTVPSFGVPGNGLNIGWDLDVPDSVERCAHALALDERRKTFPPWRPLLRVHDVADPPRLTEVWFRGVHSDVGGGNRNPGLSSIALDWMYAQAEAAGLPFTPHLTASNRTRMDPTTRISTAWYDLILDPPRPVLATDRVHHTVRYRPRDGRRRHHNNPPVGLARVDNHGRTVGTFTWPASATAAATP
jgi:uncharacterized protein (DUF2235 family)